MFYPRWNNTTGFYHNLKTGNTPLTLNLTEKVDVAQTTSAGENNAMNNTWTRDLCDLLYTADRLFLTRCFTCLGAFIRLGFGLIYISEVSFSSQYSSTIAWCATLQMYLRFKPYDIKNPAEAFAMCTINSRRVPQHRTPALRVLFPWKSLTS